MNTRTVASIRFGSDEFQMVIQTVRAFSESGMDLRLS